VSLYKFFLLKKIVKLRQFFAVNKKKERKKKLIFAPEIALRVERSDPAQNPYFAADFLNARFQCSRLLHN
jgi:hypothetical protein